MNDATKRRDALAGYEALSLEEIIDSIERMESLRQMLEIAGKNDIAVDVEHSRNLFAVLAIVTKLQARVAALEDTVNS